MGVTEGDGDITCHGCHWNGLQRRTSRKHPYCSIVVIGQNIEKSPEDLRKLAFNQTPVKDYQVRPV